MDIYLILEIYEPVEDIANILKYGEMGDEE